jgi:hypothetical protein
MACLALCCVTVVDFGHNLPVVGPELDPSFSLRLCGRQADARFAFTHVDLTFRGRSLGE